MELRLGSLQFNVIHTPGHTLGGCCLLLKVDDGPDHYLRRYIICRFCSDGQIYQIQEAILIYYRTCSITKLWPLKSDTVVYPGHGPVTTIGVERATNPFVGSNSPAFGKYHRLSKQAERELLELAVPLPKWQQFHNQHAGKSVRQHLY